MVLIGTAPKECGKEVYDDKSKKIKVDDKNAWLKIMGDKDFMKKGKQAIKDQKGLSLFGNKDGDKYLNILDNKPRKKSKQFDVSKI